MAQGSKQHNDSNVVQKVKPYGDLGTATVLVIGHDPRLQRSKAEAKYPFFFETLTGPPPTSASERRKYELAQAVCEYINWLADRLVSLKELYVTNLCNEFLPHVNNWGTVLIPDDKAEHGLAEIEQAIAEGHFSVILPMAVQTFYHLCRLGFVDEQADVLKRFVAAARPRTSKVRQGVYVPTGVAPFLAVCGQRFHHRGIPVIPILHVKQWPLKSSAARYAEPMERARQEVRAFVGQAQTA